MRFLGIVKQGFHDFRLLFHERIQAGTTISDSIEVRLPDGSRIRICDGIRERLYSHAAHFRRHELFLIDRDKACFLQELDDPGSGRLRPDTLAFLEFRTKLLVLDVLIDFLHSLKERSVREAFRRRRGLLFDLSVLITYRIAFADLREDRRLLSFLLVLTLVDHFPAKLQDLLAVCDKRLIGAGNDDFRRKVRVDREELRKICFGDEEIEILFLFRKGVEIRRLRRRDEGVMRRDLLIVPYAGAHGGVCLCGKLLDFDIRQRPEVLEDRRSIRKLVRRQVLAVRSRIGSQLLFVKRLHGIEDHLRGIPVAASGIHLQRGKGEAEPLPFLLLFLLNTLDHCTVAMGSDGLDLLEDSLRNLFLQEPALAVEAVHILLHLPGGRDIAILMVKQDFCDIMRCWDEMLDLVFPADYQGKRRGLYAADMQDAIIASGPCIHRVATGEVHANQPVRLAAGTGTVPETGEVVVLAKIRKCLLDGFLVEGIEEDTLRRLLVATVFEDFIDKKLPFPVRVAGIDDDIRLLEEFLDDLELLAGVLLNLELPDRRDDRQILHGPVLILLVVLVRAELLQDMAEAPGYDILPVIQRDIAVFFQAFPQIVCNRAAEGWLFGDE